jgi:hypothetical protein
MRARRATGLALLVLLLGVSGTVDADPIEYTYALIAENDVRFSRDGFFQFPALNNNGSVAFAGRGIRRGRNSHREWKRQRFADEYRVQRCSLHGLRQGSRQRQLRRSFRGVLDVRWERGLQHSRRFAAYDRLGFYFLRT